MNKTDNQVEQTSDQVEVKPKKTIMKGSGALIFAAILLAGGSVLVGYSVGHKQGLTVVGFDADAEELAQIVTKQKTSLETLGVSLNTATQERDIALTNAKELKTALEQSQAIQLQTDSLNATYREKLRERGGLSLTIQNIAIKPLPSNAYEYVLDLIQVSPNNRRATGRLEIRLINQEEILTVPLESALYNFDSHERLTGRWTMPNGFTPKFIEIHLKGGEATIQRFAWQQGKATIDSPAFISEIPQTEANAD